MNLFNKKLFYLVCITLSGTTWCMQNQSIIERFDVKNTKEFWDTRVDTKNNTNLHQLVGFLYRAEDNLGTIINAYKQALRVGADDTKKNLNDATAHQLMYACCSHKLMLAIKSDNHDHIIELMATAPELCFKTHRHDETPLECAIRTNNLFAQALIEEYLSTQFIPTTRAQILENITKYL